MSNATGRVQAARHITTQLHFSRAAGANSAVRTLVDAQARLVRAREALEDGDAGLAAQLLADIEGDLAATLAAVAEATKAAA